MKKGEKISNEHISALNNAKKAMIIAGNNFTKESILEALRGCGLPTNDTFWKIFKQSGIIECLPMHRYRFANNNPIYIGALTAIYTKYQKTKQDIYKFYCKPKQENNSSVENTKEVVETAEIINDDAAILSAIKLLKSKGYQVLKPAGILYKVV